MFIAHCTGKNATSNVVYKTLNELLYIGLFTFIITKLLF